jgi:hypothetical protein
MACTICIQVIPVAAPMQAFAIEGDRVCIGSAAYCEVRLPLGEAAAEHVVLEDRGAAGLFAHALSSQPPPTVDGVVFSVVRLEPAAVLRVGSTKIRATTQGLVAKKDEKAKAKSNPVILLAAAVVIPVGIWQLTLNQPDSDVTAPTEAPPLFSESAATCPQAQAQPALAYALEQVELADAKRERHPFHAYDGVQAVGLYHVAAACFRSGGDPTAAKEVDEAGADLQRKLNESYRTHRVRLEHALSVDDKLVARQEVRALRDLTTGRPGAYVSWLSNLERRLQLAEGTQP